MTRQQEWINKINDARSKGFLTQANSQTLRQLVNNLATSSGDLGPQKRDQINNSFKSLLNNQGKIHYGFSSAPQTPSTPITLPTPQQPGSPSTPTPPPATPRTPPPPSGNATPTWSRFQEMYPKLSSNHKNIVRNIFGGVGNPLNHFAFWGSLSDQKRTDVVRAIQDGKISTEERDNLYKRFNYTPPSSPPPGGEKPPPTPPPGGEKPEPPPGGENKNNASATWKSFEQLYPKLSSNHKNIVRNIFGGVGNPLNHFAFWAAQTDHRRSEVIRAIRDGKITTEERDNLYKLFKFQEGDKPDSGKGDGGADTDGPETGDDNTGEGDDDGDEGRGVEDDFTSPSGPEDTAVVSNKKDKTKIKFPKKGGQTNIFIPDDADFRISMPEVERKTTKEINRITKNLVNATREFLESGQSYRSIDYVPSREIFSEDELLSFIGNSPNNPTAGDQTESEYFKFLFSFLYEAVKAQLDQGDPAATNNDLSAGSEYYWDDGTWIFFGGDFESLPRNDPEEEPYVNWTWDANRKLWFDPDQVPPADAIPPDGSQYKGFDYAEYLKLFEREFRGAGSPYYLFSTEVEDDIILGELSVVFYSDSAAEVDEGTPLFDPEEEDDPEDEESEEEE